MKMKIKIVAFLVAFFILLGFQPAQSASHETAEAYLSAAKNMTTRNTMSFSGNVKTLKYHNESCKFYDCRDCTKFFKTREAAQKAGYKACGKCGG